jgi:uncharacterized DUF497 family protein
MQIEFDPVKDRINREKHGVGLDAASEIFATPSVQWISLRERHGEVRYIAVGLLNGLELLASLPRAVNSHGSYL